MPARILFTIADWFEGLIWLGGMGLLAVGGVFLMQLAKSDDRLQPLKLAGIGLLLFSVTTLLGLVAFKIGREFHLPERFLQGTILHTLYVSMREVVSGLIDIGAGALVFMGASKTKKNF